MPWRTIVIGSLLSAISTMSLSAASLHPPFDTVDILYPFMDSGHYTDENRAWIEQLIQSYEITTVIEVGAFLGKATLHIAQALPPTGRVYAVDHWLTSRMPALPLVPEKPWEQFLSNLIHAGLTERVVPIRTDSVTAALVLNTTADLIYINPSHDFFSLYTHLNFWHRHLNPRGVLCGTYWHEDVVQQAVSQFLKDHPELVMVHGISSYCLYNPSNPPLYRKA